MMDRRRFLAWLGGTAAGVALAPVLDLDRLLWVPGEKRIFLPTPARRLIIDKELGIAIRFVQQYDIHPDQSVNRFDLLIGIPEPPTSDDISIAAARIIGLPFRPAMSCRVVA